MTLKVADVRANLNENIRHAARILGTSKARLSVFSAIYAGQKQIKSVSELMKATGMSRVRVLQEAGKLSGNGIVEQVKVDGETGYKKDKTYTLHKKSILDLVKNPSKKNRFPTKQEPKVQGGTAYRIVVPKAHPKPTVLTVDDVDSFKKVSAVASPNSNRLSKVPESRIKNFLKKVLGETHDFKDWGGEKNDLYSNKLRLGGKRRTAAFAIKGKATSGPLTPKKMGKNADQLGRLLTSQADVFFVVYHGKIDESVHAQLRAYAVARALNGDRVYYGVIDGDDLHRLVVAYQSEFDRARA